MSREAESLLVSFCGVDGVGNAELGQRLKTALDGLGVLPKPVELVANIASRLKERGYPMDAETTQEAQWAIEWAWLDAEQRLRNVPKIFCRSVVDRMAYNRVCQLGMDLHFEDVLPSSVKRYTVLFYTPADGEAVQSRHVDTVIRNIIKDYVIPVQVLVGTQDIKLTTVLEAVKLRLGI